MQLLEKIESDALCIFPPASPNDKIYKTIVKYQKQDAGIDRIHHYLDFLSFPCTHLCVCLR